MEKILFVCIAAAVLCGAEGNLENQGQDCWNQCSTYDAWIQEGAGGPCSFCGSDGMCCRRGWKTDLGCDGSIGTDGYHGCVPKPVALEHQNEDCYSQCGGDGYPCSWCGTDGICCRQGWWYGKNGCDSSMGTSGYHGCVAKPTDRTWNCNILDKWDVKQYELYKQDFCEREWQKEGEWWWNNAGSQPTCDDKVAPTVTFFVGGSSEKICSIDMNQGRGGNHNSCLAKVKANANQGAVRAACADQNTYCAYWASVGECNKNPAYMLNYCQQSCNVCNTGTGGETWMVYFAHGFQDDGGAWFPLLREAFAQRYEKAGRTVILAEVNWSYASGPMNRADRMLREDNRQGHAGKYTPVERNILIDPYHGITCNEAGALAGYLEAASNTMVVGHLLGLLTQDIVNLGISNLKTMCVGHSLGGHICGFTGKTKQLDAIIGLDTAGPIFERNSPHKRLNKGDAKVVYSIHMNSAILGIKKPVGDYDIYVNGGKNQPDCGVNIVCSHCKFTHGLMQKIWKNGPCIFGKIVPDLGEASPGAYTPGVHGVRTTDQGCEFIIDNVPAAITRWGNSMATAFGIFAP